MPFNRPFTLSKMSYTKVQSVKIDLVYNRKSGVPSFRVGQSVWRFYSPLVKKKFGKGWTGPYLVVHKTSELVYGIQKTPEIKEINVHVDHLKAYEGDHPVINWIEVPDDDDVEVVTEEDVVEFDEEIISGLAR